MRNNHKDEAKQTGVEMTWDEGPLDPVRLAVGTAEIEPIATTDIPHGFRDDDIAQIVHDLKSPLATISLESELLDGSIDHLDQEAMCSAVHRILLNVGFLDRMIQDLLDLCAIDAGRFVLHETHTDLRMLVESVIDRVVSSRDQARVSFEESGHIKVVCDELRIERVVANLIENALKYAPPSSGVVVLLSAHDRSVCVSVEDAGPGIADSDREAIFDKFRRVHRGPARPGNGLGLYVSKRIVEAHGGHIGVDAAGGHTGSRFYFELPLP